jgi:DNA-binding FrmR family transcriptional regulator
VGYIVLASHMNSCVKEDIIAGKDGVIDETVELIKKLK